jgi:hypothetical protein
MVTLLQLEVLLLLIILLAAPGVLVLCKGVLELPDLRQCDTTHEAATRECRQAGHQGHRLSTWQDTGGGDRGGQDGVPGVGLSH